MTPADIADRLKALDWSNVPVEHQLLASMAAETLRANPPEPITTAEMASGVAFRQDGKAVEPRSNLDAENFGVRNVVPLNARRKTRWTSIVTLEGHKWLTSAHFGPDGAWGWIVESIAQEHGCDEDAVGSLEADDSEGDLVTVDGLPMYRIRTEWV